MNVDAWLTQATHQLKAAGLATARLDCLILLEDSVGQDRSWLLAHPEFKLTQAQLSGLNQFISRRATHEPLAYIRGHAEFYGRDFRLNHHVLQPRPESEALITLLKTTLSKAQKKQIIVDIGTGSGALAITAALERPTAEVWATDIDVDCLKVAQQNTQQHQVTINFAQGNLLEPLIKQQLAANIILANLPYVPTDYPINPAAQHEPKLALYGGHNGLDLYHQLFQQVSQLHPQPSHIICESLPSQHHSLTAIANDCGYQLRATLDLGQHFTRPV